MRKAAALLLTIAFVAAGQTAIPETHAGKALRSWLEAFNSGDRTKLAGYLEKYEPNRKDRLDSLLGFREQTGGFKVIRIEKSEPLHIEALVKERDGSNFAQFKMDVNDTDPPPVKKGMANIV